MYSVRLSAEISFLIRKYLGERWDKDNACALHQMERHLQGIMQEVMGQLGCGWPFHRATLHGQSAEELKPAGRTQSILH